MKTTIRSTALLMAVLMLALSFALIGCNGTNDAASDTTSESVSESESVSDLGLYEAAVQDAVFADANEILPLVTLTKDSDMVTWNETDDKVLLLSWNKYPDSYPDGSTFVCSYGEVWAFTDKEILAWYNANGEGVEDWDLRLEQLIGLPEDNGYTHFTAFWVDIDEVIRPAYQTDVTKQVTEDDLTGAGPDEYKTWFDGNIVWSYFDSAYPWTRLGYTYDWNDNGTEYGLSEFIILKDSTVEVAWTVTTAEFLQMLASGHMVKDA